MLVDVKAFIKAAGLTCISSLSGITRLLIILKQ